MEKNLDFELTTMDGDPWRLTDAPDCWRLFVFHRHLG